MDLNQKSESTCHNVQMKTLKMLFINIFITSSKRLEKAAAHLKTETEAALHSMLLQVKLLLLRVMQFIFLAWKMKWSKHHDSISGISVLSNYFTMLAGIKQ